MWVWKLKSSRTFRAIEADSERIAEVLANLLTNALRHTPPGGIVNVSARQRDDQLEIAVADNGEGIAPEHIDRVFERFYRIDPARSRASGGTGIGLAIVRAIAEAHGGSVTAISPGTGSGTIVTLLLPIHHPPAVPLSRLAVCTDPGSRHRGSGRSDRCRQPAGSWSRAAQ